MDDGERPPLDGEVYDDHVANAAWEGMPVDSEAPIAWWMSSRARDLRTPVGARVRRRGIEPYLRATGVATRPAVWRCWSRTTLGRTA